MTDSALDKAVLPDGSTVEVSAVPLPWWTTQHGSGFVSPTLCAPDPHQPRKHISEESAIEMCESVTASGVREPITVTPRHLAPWVTIDPQHEHAYFVIVSGHRRWTGATRAELEAIPVRVRIYASAQEHRLEASILNKDRENLTPLEEGFEIIDLREVGWTMKEICAHFGGVSEPHLYTRMNLTRLAPDIQAQLDPKLSEKRRLPVGMAGDLGSINVPTVEELDEILEALGPEAHPEDGFDVLFEELDEDGRRFELQRMFLRVIQKKHLKAARATNLIKDHALRLNAKKEAPGKKAQRFQPARRRKIVDSLLTEIIGSVLSDWRPTDFHDAYDTASSEELSDVLKRFCDARASLDGIETRIRKIAESQGVN